MQDGTLLKLRYTYMHHSTQHIPAIIQSLAPIVSQYGYLAVGGLLFLEDFGVLVPGETVLITAAFYAGLGRLDIVVVFIVGFLCAMLGDNVGFAIGHYGGHPLAERYGKYVLLTPARIAKAESFFNRYGGRVVAIARFIDGLRQVNGIIAGLSEMRWLKFLGFNALGAFLWISVWSTVGYMGGSHIALFLHFELYFTIAIFGGLACYVAYKAVRKKAHAKQSL